MNRRGFFAKLASIWPLSLLIKPESEMFLPEPDEEWLTATYAVDDQEPVCYFPSSWYMHT